MRRYRPTQSGFAIIEVLVSLTLLAAVYLVLTHAYLTALSVTNRGGRVTIASALAAKKLEEVRTRVEGQSTRTLWRQAHCDYIIAEGTTAFPAPHAKYTYRVLVNQNAVAASPSQDVTLLLPCWSIEWADATRATPCSGANYSPGCVADDRLVHEERLRWLTVEVFYQGGAQPVVRMTTAVIRGAYHR